MSYDDYHPDHDAVYTYVYIPRNKVRFPSDSVLDDADKLAAMSGECVTVVSAKEET